MGQRIIGLGAAAAVLLAGCGGGHKASTSSGTSTSSSTTSAASAPPRGVRGHVLTSNELPGFESAGVRVYRNLQSWLTADQLAAAQAASERAMLSRNGFREGVRENLVNGGTAGLSVVGRFRSPQAARAALAFYVQLLKSHSPGAVDFFPVHGIPGAQGIAYAHGAAVNIAFSNGSYYYLVGEAAGGATRTATLNTAARHLYHRLHQ
jgi:hypothetical protein